ncbi:hypothetical protein CCACVL1_00091, partial [Corchorus capsularis]
MDWRIKAEVGEFLVDLAKINKE